MAKMSVSTLLGHLALAADIPVSDVAKGETVTTKGAKCWKYKYGEETYGGPVDCSGLITAIARKVDASHARFTSSDMESTCKGDMSTMPETPGIFLWKSGHVAIYTGNGYTIEAIDETYNCGRRGNRKDKFTKWGYLDFVEYK